MKKRILSLLLALTLACSLLVFPANAAEADVVWSTSSNDTVLMVSCDGAMPGYSAKAPEWSTLKDRVTTLIVEDNVTSIGHSAFKGFTKLESVSVPKSVSTVGESAFEGCTALQSIALPGVVTIEENAFNGCSKLETVTLPASLMTVRQNAFIGCSALKDVYFGGTEAKWRIVTANMGTGNEALTKATKHVICDKHTIELQNVVKPTCTEKGYTGDEVCKVCGTVIVVGHEDPAYGHDWLKWKVVTKATDTQEGLEQRICYNDNSHVQKVQIPAGTVYAPDRAELLEEANESITVPNSRSNILWLKWVAEGMQEPNAETKNPYSDVTADDLFYKAVLWALDAGILTAPAETAADKTLAPNTALTAEQVAAIAGDGTLPVSGYEKDIPHVVTYKTTVKEWVIPTPTEAYDSNFTYVFSSDGKSVSIKIYKGTAEKVVIPEKVGGAPVVCIRDGAFQNKAKITEVTIPATVTNIGNYAFDGCTNLRDVYYDGSADQWSDVFIESNNEPLIGANIHFASTPAKIESDPADVTMLVGQTAFFTVVASGDIASYQWQVKTTSGKWKSSTAPGCTTDTMRTTATAARNGYQYRCIVTDVDGNVVISEPATLRVVAPAAITGSPMNCVGKAGQIAAFAVSAEGEGLTYKWQYSDDGGETWKNSSVKSAIYSTKMTEGRNGRMVRCVVIDQFGNSAVSDAAVMRIKNPLVITLLPQNYVGKVNSTASFTVTAQGSGLAYQWQISDNGGKSWSNSSVKSAVYSTKLTASRDGRMVRCVVSDHYGNSVATKAVSMTIG